MKLQVFQWNSLRLVSNLLPHDWRAAFPKIDGSRGQSLAKMDPWYAMIVLPERSRLLLKNPYDLRSEFDTSKIGGESSAFFAGESENDLEAILFSSLVAVNNSFQIRMNGCIFSNYSFWVYLISVSLCISSAVILSSMILSGTRPFGKREGKTKDEGAAS